MDDDHRRANLFHSSLDYQLFDKSKKIFSDKNSYFPFKASKYITKKIDIIFLNRQLFITLDFQSYASGALLIYSFPSLSLMLLPLLTGVVKY
jgi:hypothetical protein